MKKFIYIFFAALLLGAVSCTDLLDANLRNLGQQLPEDATLTVGFNTPTQLSTKAMGEDPDISSMHVFVFIDNGTDGNGTFLEMKQAKELGIVNRNTAAIDTNANGQVISPVNTTNNKYLMKWAVDLKMGRTKRRLHFVANLPSGFTEPSPGASEVTVMRSLKTTGGNTAYWQMVELENGVQAYTYPGTAKYMFVNSNGVLDSLNVPGTYNAQKRSYTYTLNGEEYTVNEGDYISTQGYKVLDGKSFYASTELSKAVQLIPLIRNFARIKVLTTSSSNSDFRLDSAVLINVPVAGYVAPFDDGNGHSCFVSAYQTVRTTPLSHDVIYQSGYPATIPSDGLVTGLPADNEKVKALTANGRDSVILYMYERGIPNSQVTSLLVKGHRTASGSPSRWYKIEIADENGSFFPIYRDFTYEVEIKKITGSDGYSTMKEAFGKPSIGDISSSEETKTLTRIDDGNGLELWVEYIDYTGNNKRDTTVGLLYKFYKGNENYTADSVTVRINPVADRPDAIKFTQDSTLTGTSYSGTDTPDGKTGWYRVDVPLYGMGDATSTKWSTLHVEGKDGSKIMYRDIDYRVITMQDMTISATPLATENKGDSTILTITLPEYLGYSLFPLTLMIEAEKNNLNPTSIESLSVESGSSLNDSSKPSFHFLKTISYSDYLANPTFTVHLKTTRDGTTANSNSTMVYVVDKGHYFNLASDYVAVGTVFMLSANTASVAANETSTKFTLYSTGNENPEWSLSAVGENSSDVRLSQETGTGTKTITVNFLANQGTSAKTYTIRATRGNSSQDFVITQGAPVFDLSANSVTLESPDAASTSFDVISTGNAEWTVSTEDAGVSFSKSTRAVTASVSGTGNATITVSVPANERSSNKTYTITATCPGFATKTFTITQKPLTLTPESVNVKASATETSFSVNSNAAWTISSTNNVTTATKNGANVNVTFPQNLSSTGNTQAVTRTVTVTLGEVSRTCTITQAGSRRVTFTTNSSNGNFNGNTNSKTTDGVTLTFNNIRNRVSGSDGYLEISINGTFVVSSDSAITNITINYTGYNYGRSTNSSSNPVTASGTVYATNNNDPTGTWTGSANSITFTMGTYSSGNGWNSTTYYSRIKSIVVSVDVW